MKARKHGSAFVMETCQGNSRIVTRGFLLAVLSLVSIAASSCGYNPPRDKNGNLPDHVVRNFITLVKADEYRAASLLWYGPSKTISRPENFIKEVENFEQFCSRYKTIELSNCKISRPRRGKAGFSIVNVDWEENGEKKHYSFGLKVIDYEWRMERGYDW